MDILQVQANLGNRIGFIYLILNRHNI